MTPLRPLPRPTSPPLRISGLWGASGAQQRPKGSDGRSERAGGLICAPGRLWAERTSVSAQFGRGERNSDRQLSLNRGCTGSPAAGALPPPHAASSRGSPRAERRRSPSGLTLARRARAQSTQFFLSAPASRCLGGGCAYSAWVQ